MPSERGLPQNLPALAAPAIPALPDSLSMLKDSNVVLQIGKARTKRPKGRAFTKLEHASFSEERLVADNALVLHAWVSAGPPS